MLPLKSFCVGFGLCYAPLLSLISSALWLQNNKVRRFAFELKMQDKSTYLLAADSEAEMEDWINTLNKILHSSFEIAMQEKRNGDVHDGVCVYTAPVGTRMSKSYSKSAKLIKPYSDKTISVCRPNKM